MLSSASCVPRATGRSIRARASSLRSRESDALYAEAEKVYVEQGFIVLEDRPRWNDFSAIRLDYMRTADDEKVSDNIEKQPAHWAVYLTEDYGYFDTKTGEPVDDGDVDDDTRDDAEAEAAEGLRHYSTVTEKTVIVPEWYCLDYVAAGLHLGPSLRDRHPSTVSSETGTGDDSPKRSPSVRRSRRRPSVGNAARCWSSTGWGRPLSRCDASTSPSSWHERPPSRERPPSWPTA